MKEVKNLFICFFFTNSSLGKIYNWLWKWLHSVPVSTEREVFRSNHRVWWLKTSCGASITGCGGSKQCVVAQIGVWWLKARCGGSKQGMVAQNGVWQLKTGCGSLNGSAPDCDFTGPDSNLASPQSAGIC